MTKTTKLVNRRAICNDTKMDNCHYIHLNCKTSCMSELRLECKVDVAYLNVVRINVVEDKHHSDEQQPPVEIIATPPATRHLDTISQHISEHIRPLQRITKMVSI